MRSGKTKLDNKQSFNDKKGKRVELRGQNDYPSRPYLGIGALFKHKINISELIQVIERGRGVGRGIVHVEVAGVRDAAVRGLSNDCAAQRSRACPTVQLIVSSRLGPGHHLPPFAQLIA